MTSQERADKALADWQRHRGMPVAPHFLDTDGAELHRRAIRAYDWDRITAHQHVRMQRRRTAWPVWQDVALLIAVIVFLGAIPFVRMALQLVGAGQ